MRAAVDCGEMDQRDAREELVVGNACGEKMGNHGSKSSTEEVSQLFTSTSRGAFPQK